MAQMPQFTGFKTAHTFADSMYSRAVWRPAGVTVVGKLHKHEHFTFLLTGSMRIYTEDGPKDYHAPAFFVTPAGTKRATHALTDSVLMTIHRLPVDTRDLQAIEDQLIDAEHDQLALFDAENKIKDDSLTGPGEQKSLEKCE